MATELMSESFKRLHTISTSKKENKPISSYFVK